MKQECITIPAFENMELISQGEGARTFRASWKNVDVVVKKGDLWNQRLIVHELEHEERVYRALKKLQGHYIPQMKVAGILNGMEMILVTEFVGTDLCEEQLNSSDRDKIRAALSAIHRLGVLHGDIRPHNIVANRDGQNSQFFFIDFGLSKFTRAKMALEREAEELESLLGTMPWPGGKSCQSDYSPLFMLGQLIISNAYPIAAQYCAWDRVTTITLNQDAKLCTSVKLLLHRNGEFFAQNI